jgi:hypothetical protein
MSRQPYIDQPSHNPAYVGATFQNVHFGKTPGRSHVVYATLVSADGETLISATIDYLMSALEERVSPLQMDDFERLWETVKSRGIK